MDSIPARICASTRCRRHQWRSEEYLGQARSESCFVGVDSPLLTWPALEPPALCVAAVDCRRRYWSVWLESVTDRETAMEAICRHGRFVVVTAGCDGRFLEALDDEVQLVDVCARSDAAAREVGKGAEFHVYVATGVSRAIVAALNAERLRQAPMAGSA